MFLKISHYSQKNTCVVVYFVDLFWRTSANAPSGFECMKNCTSLQCRERLTRTGEEGTCLPVSGKSKENYTKSQVFLKFCPVKNEDGFPPEFLVLLRPLTESILKVFSCHYFQASTHHIHSSRLEIISGSL